ncbi:MAG: GyrI-like domain-containing protein [Acidobacteriota bacterium]
MNLRELDAFVVVGIEIRTTNAAERTGDGRIPRQWERFVKENLALAIPHRVDDKILAVYTDYEGGEHGEYSFVLGARVSFEAAFPDGPEIPAGMTLRRIPAAKYGVITSRRGPVRQVVPEAWQQVWNSPEIHRGFQADFEIYDERAANPEDAVVELWVGISAPAGPV